MLSRLPETLVSSSLNAELEIIVAGPPGSYLAESTFVSRYLPLASTDPAKDWFAVVVENAQQLADLGGDYYFLGSDALAHEIAVSGLPLATKLTLLPTRTEKAVPMMGSKVGFVEVTTAAGVHIPDSEVAANAAALESMSTRLTTPALVKGDLGAGGSSVMKLTDPLLVPESWFPVVVQSEIPGHDVAVEALFVNGVLAGWLYSAISATVSPHGPSAARHFVTPPALDFADDLARLGSYAQLHGFFNCSFRWSSQDGEHILFEADPRPNTWFQMGPELGVSWGALLTGASTQSSPVLGRRGRVIRTYPHEIVGAITRGNLVRLLRWVGLSPGTWNTRNWRDEVVNRYEHRLIANAFRQVVARALLGLRKALPSGFTVWLERSGVFARMNRLLGQRRG